MRGETWQLKDVPKGKRWSYFWHYYGFRVFMGVLIGFLALDWLYVIFIRPRSDISVLWLSDRYDLLGENVFRDKLQDELDWDLNGDGTASVTLNYVDFDAAYTDLAADTKQSLLTIFSVGDNYIYFVNDYARDWLSENELLGSWDDFGGWEGRTGTDPFDVNTSDVPFFSDEYPQSLEDIHICIALPLEGDEEAYAAQMDALRNLLLYGQ